MNTIFTDSFELPDYNKAEIMRYAGVRQSSPALEGQLDRCLALCGGVFAAKICYALTPVRIDEDEVELSFIKTRSSSLAKNLSGCDEAAVFAATVGMDIDRLIKRASVTDMAQAVWLQAVGAERIESLCRLFCARLDEQLRSEGRFTRPRFSPGYGDLALDVQKDMISFLDSRRKIGVSLTESLLMSPSKSVTAIVGIGREECSASSGSCAYCDREKCAFREVSL